MVALAVENLSFRVGEKTIVDRVALEVAAGETLALLGPSGSGKTTLLRLIAGLDPSNEGRVSFDDQNLSGVPAHRRGFGLMFQDHALFPHLDTAGNVGFGLKGMDSTKKRRRVAELLELVGLRGFEGRRIDKLSGGERQRVALARALAPSPRLLMLDEPLASVDRGLRQRLVGELREILTRLEIPAIYVTHDQVEAFALADGVAIMDEGRVVRIGTPREIWDDPQTEFVARFLGMENIVVGVRDERGMVTTDVGVFGPLPGPNGLVKVLLRAEGAELVESAGVNVATATVESVVFQGATAQVTLASEPPIAFALPSEVATVAVGAPVYVAVPHSREIAAETRPPEDGLL